MGRLIDDEAAVNALTILADKMDESGASVMQQAIDTIRAIEAYPEQPKRGKWVRYYIRPNVFKDLYWHCSECGHRETYSYANRYYKFCPCCGAYMGGKDDR